MEVLRTFLEIATPEALVPGAAPTRPSRTERIEVCPVSFARWLYAEVGRAYRWVDRLSWTDEQYRERLGRENVSLWLMSVGAAPAGYFELEVHEDSSVEIVYFGLLPDFMGHGLGRRLLADAVGAAFDRGASRVWLHTCSLDDPRALPNYLARGFRAFRTETYTVDRPAPTAAANPG